MTTAYGTALWWIICTLFTAACVLGAVIWSRHEAEVQDLAGRRRRVVAVGVHDVLAACARGALRSRGMAEDPRDQPAASHAGALVPSQAHGADLLAAPVFIDEDTVINPLTWWAAWEVREPVHANAWLARAQQREWRTATAAQAARESARRIGESIRSRRAVAEQAGLIAAIRASYAELTLEGTWDDLVAAIRGVMGSAA